MNFRPMLFLDTSIMTANLLLRHKVRFQDDRRRQETPGSAHHDTESIILRGPKGDDVAAWFADIPHQDMAILKEFKSAKSVLTRIANALAVDGVPGKIGKAMIVSLKPGGFIDWHTDEGAYAEAYNRFHVCLIPSPGAFLYSGGEQASPAVGWLTFFNNRALHSAINLGQTPRVHLIVDVRKPEKVDEEA